MFKSAVILCTIGSAVAFAPSNPAARASALNAKSKSVPFLEQPPTLDGTLPGDVGFDPLGLSSLFPEVRIPL